MSAKPSPSIDRIEKPWGFELVWAKTNQYVGKLLFIRAGESLSLQFHRKKMETMYFESGECIVDTGPSESELRSVKFQSGDVFHIPPETLHRLKAVTDCRVFEVSTAHLDDVVRLQDKYGRT